MTRILAVLPALLCALVLALVAPSWRIAALVGGGLGAGEALLAAVLLTRTISGSHDSFLKAFLLVFASQAVAFGLLGLLAWKGVFAWAPLLGVYGIGAVGGTLAVGLRLKPRIGKDVAVAR